MDANDLTPVVTPYRVSFKTEGQIGRGLQEGMAISRIAELVKALSGI